VIGRLVVAAFGTSNLSYPAITGTTIDFALDPANAAVVLTFTKDGTVTTSGSGSFADWVVPAAANIGAGYEIEFHVNSGSISAGTLDTWLSLAADKSVTVSQTVIGENETLLRVKIRRVSDSVVVSEGVVTLNAIVEV